ncbi:MAG: AEC family transporter [Lachnospiraceae bacterium]|nr:AEC family transporter [Lachnospiraceae bacterium]
MITIVFGLIFKIVFLLAVGFFMKKKGILSSQDQKSMTTVLMKIVVFFMIIMSSQNEFSLDAVKAIAITGVVAVITYAVGIPLTIFLAKRLGLPADKQRVFVLSAMFCNVTFMGYPICQELFGDVGLLCAIMYSMIYNIIFYTWGFAYLGGTGKMNLKSIFTNKVAVCSVLAIVFYFLQIKIPEPLAGTFSTIGSMTFPLSMLITGCSLADADLLDIIRNRQIYLITFIRMLLTPAVIYGGMRLLGFDGLVLQACTIMSALPTGTMTGIVATEYHCAPDYAAKAMVQTIIAMVLTLPLWIYIIQM